MVRAIFFGNKFKIEPISVGSFWDIAIINLVSGGKD